MMGLINSIRLQYYYRKLWIKLSDKHIYSSGYHIDRSIKEHVGDFASMIEHTKDEKYNNNNPISIRLVLMYDYTDPTKSYMKPVFFINGKFIIENPTVKTGYQMIDVCELCSWWKIRTNNQTSDEPYVFRDPFVSCDEHTVKDLKIHYDYYNTKKIRDLDRFES